jgi:putative transcriptional regulator
MVRTWPCPRFLERQAIKAATRGCTSLSAEVFDCPDLDSLIDRADTFFARFPEPATAIRNHLSRVMGGRRLKIQDVASRSGLAYTTVFALYHDKARRIDLSTLDALCHTLDAQVGDLFEYVPDERVG